MAKNRTCHTCGEKYYYCPTCPDDSRNPQIYIMWCGERCKKIFETLSKQTMKEITIEECKDILISENITKEENLNPIVRKHVNDVMGYELETENVQIEDSVNTESTTESVNDVSEKAVTFKQIKKKKKR